MSGIEPQDAAAEGVVQQGRQTIIVLLESREGVRDASRRMAQIEGMQRIARGVYQYGGRYARLRASQDLPKHVALRKTRSIPRVRETTDAGSPERTYALVTYRFRNPTAKQKKVVQRLKRRAPAARFRPGVLLFPHIRAGETRKQFRIESKRPPIGSLDFTKILSELDAEVNRYTKLRLANPSDIRLVNESIESTIALDAEAIEKRLKVLRRATQDESTPTRKLQVRYKEISRDFRDLKTTALVIYHVWRYDSRSRLKRVYDLLMAARRAISSRDD